MSPSRASGIRRTHSSENRVRENARPPTAPSAPASTRISDTFECKSSCAASTSDNTMLPTIGKPAERSFFAISVLWILPITPVAFNRSRLGSRRRFAAAEILSPRKIPAQAIGNGNRQIGMIARQIENPGPVNLGVCSDSLEETPIVPGRWDHQQENSRRLAHESLLECERGFRRYLTSIIRNVQFDKQACVDSESETSAGLSPPQRLPTASIGSAAYGNGRPIPSRRKWDWSIG